MRGTVFAFMQRRRQERRAAAHKNAGKPALTAAGGGEEAAHQRPPEAPEGTEEERLAARATHLEAENGDLRERAAGLRRQQEELAAQSAKLEAILDSLAAQLHTKALAISRAPAERRAGTGPNILPSIVARYARGSAVAALKHILPSLFASSLEAAAFFCHTHLGRVPASVLGRALAKSWGVMVSTASLQRGFQRLRIANLEAAHLLMDLEAGSHDGLYPEHLTRALDWQGLGRDATRGWEDAVVRAEAIVQHTVEVLKERPEGWSAPLYFRPKVRGARSRSPPRKGAGAGGGLASTV